MDDMMRTQVYLEMSKKAIETYLCLVQDTRRPTNEEVLVEWNSLFDSTCKHLGVDL